MPICIPYVIIFHFESSCVLHPYLTQIHISITINHVTIEVSHCCVIALGSNTDSVSDFVFAFPTRFCIPKCILFLRSSCVVHCTPFLIFQLDTHFTNRLFLLFPITCGLFSFILSVPLSFFLSSVVLTSSFLVCLVDDVAPSHTVCRAMPTRRK